jgi:hypothetical protein
LEGEARETETATIRASDEESLLSTSRWSPFVATDGRKVRVSCSLEPVYSLKTQSRIGFRLRRRVIDMKRETALAAVDVAKLSRSDLLRIDMATMSRGLARLEGESSEELELSLIVPLSYISLSHPPSRQTIATALGLVRKATRAGVICEIYDAEDAPQAGLLEVVSILRPWSAVVAAYLRSAPGQNMKDVGLQALSVSCPASANGDAAFVEWLKPWLRVGKRLTRSIMVYRCGSHRRMAIAGGLGATHGSAGSMTDDSENRTIPPIVFVPLKAG